MEASIALGLTGPRPFGRSSFRRPSAWSFRRGKRVHRAPEGLVPRLDPGRVRPPAARREYASKTFLYFETFTVVALVYLVMTLFFSKLVALMEERMNRRGQRVGSSMPARLSGRWLR